MSELVGLLGMLMALLAVTLLVMGLYLYRLTARVNALARLVTGLARAREAETGTRIEIDHDLILGEPVDVVAPEGDDLWSRIPARSPWGVLPDDDRPSR